ncbi:SpaA isopeptide-forming pilin-related protein [Roseburia hominis]
MAGHTHGADCYKKVKELACGKEEVEEHKHNDNCYDSKNACGKEEHVHTLECYSDVKADVEDSAKWKKMFKDVKLGDDWGENVLTIAKTQIGYQESKKNYEVAEDGTTLKGYTRYGAWSGKNYSDWDSAFASFVLNYAQVPEKAFPTKPEDMDTVKWMNKLSESKLLGGTDAQPEAGDLVFFKRKVNNAEKNFVGIISKVEKDKDEKITYIKVIEGNYRFEEKDIVKENGYAYTDSSIQAYGLLSVAEKNYKGTDATQQEEAVEAAKEQVGTEETTKRQIFKTARSEEKAAALKADEGMQSDSRDAAHGAIESRTIASLPVTGVSGSGTTYDPNTGDFQTNLKIDFTFEKGEANGSSEYVFNYPKGVWVPGNLLNKEEDLLDENKTVAGKYSFVENEDGTYSVHVKFDQDYLNTAKDKITGHVAFDGILTTQTDEKGNIKIDIGTDLNITIPSEDITYPGNETDKFDISTQKKGSYVKDGNKLVYTVYVRSEKGTPDSISFNDKITANGVNLGTPIVTVKEKTYIEHGDWQEYSSTGDDVTPTDYSYNNGTISMSLPGLSKGDATEKRYHCYEVTYTYELGDQKIEHLSTKNKAMVESEDDKTGKTVKDEKEFDVNIDNRYSLKKSGWNENGKAKWKIEVNTNRVDIAGAVLTDEMLGEIGDATQIAVTPKDKGYQFIYEKGKIIGIKFTPTDGEVNKEYYTIEYVTDVTPNWNKQEVNNTVKFDPDPNYSGDELTDTGTAQIPGAGSVKKTSGNMTISEDGKTGIIEWKVEVNVPASGLPKGAVITESMGYYAHGITQAQINAWIASWKWEGSDKPVKLPIQWETQEKTSNNVPPEAYQKLVGTLTEDLIPPGGKDGKLVSTYYTTVDLSKATNLETSYHNEFKVDDKSGSDDYVYRKDAVVKTDGNGQMGDTSCSSEDGKLTWQVKVSVSEKNKDCKKLSVTDTLPKNVALDSITLSNGTVMDLNISSGKISGSNDEYTISGTYDATSGKVVLEMTNKTSDSPIKSNALYVFTFNCHADFETGKFEVGKTYEFKNEVKVHINDVEFGSDSQQQKWTYTKPTEEKEVLSKTGAWDNNNRLLKYSIQINPEGKDLVEGADFLTLIDTLEYDSKVHYHNNNNDAMMEIALVQNSVKLYKGILDDQGNLQKGPEVTDWKWTYSSDKVENSGDWYMKVKNTITATEVPDSTPLILEYNYSVTSTIPKGESMGNLPISNTVRIEGASEQDTEGNDNKEWKDQSSSAGIDTGRSYTFFKVETGNYQSALAGAVFSVYECNSSGEESGGAIGTYTTDQNGMFQIKFTDENIHYEHNKLYKVRETAPPEGYKLPASVKEYYFYFSNTEAENQLPTPLPTSAVDLTEAGQTVYVENENTMTSIKVNKKWLDSTTGKDITKDKQGQILVDLYQVANVECGGSASDESGAGNSVNVRYEFGQWNPPDGRWGTGSFKCQPGSIIRFSITCASKPTVYYYPYNVGYYNAEKEEMGFYYKDEKSNTYYYEYVVKEQDKESGIAIGAIAGDDKTSISKITCLASTNKYKESPYIISSANDWRLTIRNLPKKGTDANGKTVYYTYYVKESADDESMYQAKYENNSGIVSGTITITNKTTITEEYELPETGGSGTIPYTTAGLSIMLMAGFMYTLKSRKGGRRFFRN